MVKKNNPRKISLYTNLTHKRRNKKDVASRKQAQYLASLPKHPLKRFLYRLHPKRFWGYWFSKRGFFMGLKIFGIFLLILVISVGGLFAYYRKDLDKINPDQLAKRVQTTVNTFFDRDGNVLYTDKGINNYSIVVKNEDISQYLKDATVAIEDREFYKHNGVSPSGITRALWANISSHGNSAEVQGGSTLTQQLVKQVFLSDEASKRSGIEGISRKIKEVILALEVERKYSKEQILSLYLNESPYGGRRNGVESGAQTYFHKSAKDVTLGQAAILAAIPNNPSLYDPYNTEYNEALISRQHKVLGDMVSAGYITQAQADEAKKEPVLEEIQPAPDDDLASTTAPHFISMVRDQVKKQLSAATYANGGLNIYTTVDQGVQKKLNETMDDYFTNSGIPQFAGFTNGAAMIEDVKTGQVLAMIGSRNYKYPGFGQSNQTSAFVQPGSSVKPLVYAELLKQNAYGTTTRSLTDSPGMNAIYGGQLNNADGRFMGALTIQDSLARSRNVPAVKAMHIAGVQQTLQAIRADGNKSYCTDGSDAQVGLAAAIGGCGAKMTEHTSSYATLARNGQYLPQTMIIRVTNSENQMLYQPNPQAEAKQVIDPQITYMLAQMLSNRAASSALYRSGTPGYDIPGVSKIAVKTGTSDKDSKPKDLWMMAYNPQLVGAVWLGNNDTQVLANGNSSFGGRILSPVIQYTMENYYAKQGWKNGDWFVQPNGIQNINGGIFPSWYQKSVADKKNSVTFDKVSKKKATDCTPEAAKINIEVTEITDPITKKVTYSAPDGYDPSDTDTVHQCSDTKPSVTAISATNSGQSNQYKISVTVQQGTHAITQIVISVGGQSATINVSGSGTFTTDNMTLSAGNQTITATVQDSAYYESSSNRALTVSSPSPQQQKQQ